MTNEQEHLVVLVEDDQSVLRALRRLLRSAGFKVLTFNRPSLLLQANIHACDACLVVDYHLPEMNGAELCDVLAASGKVMPTIFITGDYEQTRSLIARSPGSIVLTKPFRREDLLEALANCFASR